MALQPVAGYRKPYDATLNMIATTMFTIVLVHRLKNGPTTADLRDDGIGRGRPDEGPGLLVVDGQELIDGGGQVGHAPEDAAAKALVGELAEPALDEVQPGRAGGDEVEDEAGMLRLRQSRQCRCAGDRRSTT